MNPVYTKFYSVMKELASSAENYTVVSEKFKKHTFSRLKKVDFFYCAKKLFIFARHFHPPHFPAAAGILSSPRRAAPRRHKSEKRSTRRRGVLKSSISLLASEISSVKLSLAPIFSISRALMLPRKIRERKGFADEDERQEGGRNEEEKKNS